MIYKINCSITLIIIFQITNSFAQNKNSRLRAIDSIHKVLSKRDKSIDVKKEAFLELGFLYAPIQTDSSFYYTNKSYIEMKNEPVDKYYGRYYYNLGRYYSTINEFDKAAVFYKKAIPLNKFDNDKKWYYLSVLNLSARFMQISNFVEAERLMLEMLEKAEFENSVKNIGRSFTTLSGISESMGKKKECLEYRIKAYNLFKNAKMSEDYSKIVTMLAGSYYEDKNYIKALDLFFEILEINKKSNIDFDIFHTLINISRTYQRLDKNNEALQYVNFANNIADKSNTKAFLFLVYNAKGSINKSLKNYDLAIKYFIKALDNVQFSSEISLNNMQLHYKIAKAYFDKGDLKNAELYYSKLTDSFKIKNLNYDMLQLKTEAFTLKASIDSTKQDYASEMKNFKAGVNLKDSLRALEDLTVVESIKTKFKVAEKDNNIKVLDLKNKVQKAEINSQNQKTIFFIVLSIIASILIGLLAYILKIKQKNNLQLDSKNNQLTGLLNDKELLLKEIHHRTKNNLQLLMSILKSQTRQIDKDSLSNFIQESQSRIVSMSLIHEALYNHDTSEISFEKYVHDLYNKINDVYNLDNQNIQINLNFNNINLDVQTSIILGLMLNELICNSFKYAFTDKDMGIINIDLNIQNNNQYSLQYTDNGRIIPKESTKTFGKQLIQSLAEQLSGNLTINHEKGIVVQMLFSDLKNSEVKYA